MFNEFIKSSSEIILSISYFFEWFIIYNHYILKYKISNIMLIIIIIIFFSISFWRVRKCSFKDIKKNSLYYNFKFFYRIFIGAFSIILFAIFIKLNFMEVIVVLSILLLSLILKIENLNKDKNLFEFFDQSVKKINKFRDEKVGYSDLKDYIIQTILLVFFCLVPFYSNGVNKNEFIYLAIIIFIILISPFILAKIFEGIKKKYIVITVYCSEIKKTSMRSSSYDDVYYFKNNKYNLEYMIIDKKNKWTLFEKGEAIIGVESHELIDISEK